MGCFLLGNPYDGMVVRRLKEKPKKKGKGKKKTLGKKKTRPKKTQKKQKIKGNYPKQNATAKKAKRAKRTTKATKATKAMPMPKHLDPGVMKSIMKNMDNPTDARKFAKAFTRRAPRGMEVAQKLRILDQYGNYKYDGGFSYSMIHPCRDPDDVMKTILSIVNI